MNGKMIGGFTVIEVPGVNKSWCGRLSTGDIYLTLAYCRVIYKIFKYRYDGTRWRWKPRPGNPIYVIDLNKRQ